MSGRTGRLLRELKRTGELTTANTPTQALPGSDRLFPGEGRVLETEHGPCYLRELWFPLDYRHGGDTLGTGLAGPGTAVALPARNRGLEGFDPREALFLDVETTGLAGGTGTWVFLVGLGRFAGSRFQLHQYFLRRPAEEKALLGHFATAVGDSPTLVTFNGKIFDLPLIQARQTLVGLSHTRPALHLDLLTCARNLWKKRLPSRSLRSLEETLLGLQRPDDIPGSEIPAVYFDFLRRGETGRLKQVFKHNVLDILSMVTLLGRVSAMAEGRRLEHPGELLALGKLCLEAGRLPEGAAFLRKAISSGLKPVDDEAALELSLHYKRRGRWKEAESIWREVILSGTEEPAFLVELAKYCEHRCDRLEEALILTLQALDLVDGRAAGRQGGELSIEALVHRRLRLQRRLAGKENTHPRLD